MTPANQAHKDVTSQTNSSAANRLSYAQMLDEVRALYVGVRHAIEIGEELKGREKKDEAWFTRKRAVMRALETVGFELRVIADNAAAYDDWKASLAGGSK